MLCLIVVSACGGGRDEHRRRHTATAVARTRPLCPSENVVPAGSPASMRTAEAALRCLVNQTRARNRLSRLRDDRCLTRAARGHARDMVRRGFFAHASRDGRSPGARSRSAGYAPTGARWTVGENLAWGRGRQGTPAAVLRDWMHSPSHRANVLRRDYRDIGTGVVPGAPPRAVTSTSAHPAATYAAKMGVVHSSRRCN